MGPPVAASLAALLLWAAAIDPDCADEAWKRQVMVQARLFEMHALEETLRTALAQSLERCLPGPAGGSCRVQAEAGVDGDRAGRRAEIDDRYRRMLHDFEERCRSTVM